MLARELNTRAVPGPAKCQNAEEKIASANISSSFPTTHTQHKEGPAGSEHKADPVQHPALKVVFDHLDPL